MKTYGATNPEQIISLFEMRAGIAAKMEVNASTRIGRESYNSEKLAWRAAADILANTEFVGWSTGQPVAEISATLTVEEIKNSNTPEARQAWDALQTATAAGNVVLSMEAASVILAALERPQAVESTRKYPFMREQHEAAIKAMRAAIHRAGK